MGFSTDSIMLALAAFLLGILLGMFLPIICIKFYNLVGIHLGDMIEDDESDADKENENNDR
jgi:hypothetical protein